MSLEEIKKRVEEHRETQEITKREVKELIENSKRLIEVIENVEKSNYDLSTKLSSFEHVNMKVDKDTLNYLESFKSYAEMIDKDISETVKSSPAEIKVTSKAAKFLLIYFLVSVLIIAGCIFSSFYFYNNYKTVSNQSYKEGFVKGSNSLRYFLIEKMPGASATWIKEKRPKATIERTKDYSVKELKEMKE